MDAPAFAVVVANDVYRSAISGTCRILESPPGRRPHAELQRASAWFSALGDSERAIVKWVIAEAAHAATFGVLAVIDGVRHTGPERYELVAVARDETRTTVNPENSEYLHDLFQGLVMGSDGSLDVE